jgi:hypothetical protein
MSLFAGACWASDIGFLITIRPLKGDQALAQLVERFDVHTNQLTQLKAGLLERVSTVFATNTEKREAGPHMKLLNADIVQLALETGFGSDPLNVILPASTDVVGGS